MRRELVVSGRTVSKDGLRRGGRWEGRLWGQVTQRIFGRGGDSSGVPARQEG